MEVPPWLAELQAGFADSIRQPLLIDDDGFRCHYAAYNPHAVAAMKAREDLSGFERLSTYNQQYWFRLLRILQSEFPLVCGLLGVREFNRMATAAVDRFPSRHPELHHLPGHLPRFLATSTPWSTPEIQTAATVDYAYFTAFLAERLQDLRTSPLTAARTTALLHQPIRFQASWHLIDESFDAVQTRKIAVQQTDDDASLSLTPKRSFWVIYRCDSGVTEEPLDRLQAQLLGRLSRGEPLVVACEQLQADASPDELERLTTQIQHWFQRWAVLGWFAAPAD